MMKTPTTKAEKLVKQLRSGPKTIKQLRTKCGFGSDSSVTATVANLRANRGYGYIDTIDGPGNRARYALG